jgi:hypothetical protein
LRRPLPGASTGLHQNFLCHEPSGFEIGDDDPKFLENVGHVSLFKVPEFDKLVLESAEAVAVRGPIVASSDRHRPAAIILSEPLSCARVLKTSLGC